VDNGDNGGGPRDPCPRTAKDSGSRRFIRARMGASFAQRGLPCDITSIAPTVTSWELDRRGRRLTSDDDLEPLAKSAMQRVMSERGPDFPKPIWSEWLVCVHNEFGEQVAVIPFCREELEDVERMRLVFAALRALSGLSTRHA
jgi:hypothetical protein